MTDQHHELFFPKNPMWEQLVCEYADAVLGKGWKLIAERTKGQWGPTFTINDRGFSWFGGEGEDAGTITMVALKNGLANDYDNDMPAITGLYSDGTISQRTYRKMGATNNPEKWIPAKVEYYSNKTVKSVYWYQLGTRCDSDYGHPAYMEFDVTGQIKFLHSTKHPAVTPKGALKLNAAANARMKLGMHESLCGGTVVIAKSQPIIPHGRRQNGFSH